MTAIPVTKHRVLPGKEARQTHADLTRLQKAVEGAKQLAPGASGPAVESLQRLMRSLNLYAGPVNGQYDAGTQAAVGRLETRAKVANPDGIFDGAELGNLKQGQLFVKDGFETKARLGQTGLDIKRIENKLHDLGYHAGKIDGFYDRDLEKGLRAYRKADKKVPNTPQNVIGTFVAKGLSSQIRTLEKNLKVLGAKLGSVDGSFTDKSEAAVRHFQKKHDLAPTGIANERTRKAIAHAAEEKLGGQVKKFIDIALAQRGDPYVFGSSGPDKFDCSGLIYYALNKAGVDAPRLSADGYMNKYNSSKVSRANLKPGDLIFYWYPNDRGISKGNASHIEIYLGRGKSMGTDNPSEGARVENVDWSAFIGGARVPGLR